MIQAAGEPVFLLGHSYGAQTASPQRQIVPEKVRKLVVYEPPWPHAVGKNTLQGLEALAGAGDWEGFAVSFFRDTLSVPPEELEKLRTTDLWGPIIADAKASLGDLRALSRYEFRPERFRELRIPMLLQIGTESLAGSLRN